MVKIEMLGKELEGSKLLLVNGKNTINLGEFGYSIYDEKDENSTIYLLKSNNTSKFGSADIVGTTKDDYILGFKGAFSLKKMVSKPSVTKAVGKIG